MGSLSSRSEEFSRKFADAVSRAFDVNRNNDSARSVALFLVAFAVAGMLVNALYELAAIAGVGFWGNLVAVTDARTSWGQVWVALSHVSVPLLLAGVVFVIMWRNYRHNSPARGEGFAVPKPKRGLIVMLSPFAVRHTRSGERAATDGLALQELAERLGRPGAIDPALRARILGTNWGPLYLAVEHHRPRLEACWVVVTEQYQDQYEVAELLIRRIVGERQVSCQMVAVEHSHQVEETAQVINEIYHVARMHMRLPNEDVIADFTGGTAAMSGGMILATLHAERSIEYLRQDVNPIRPDGTAMNREVLQQARALVGITTTPAVLDEILGTKRGARS